MIFSKSFGYALQSLLYVAMLKDTNKKIQLDEIAEALKIPRFFLGKVMNRLSKEGILNSVKGHNGGFISNENTLSVRLLKVAEITGEMEQLEACVLRSRVCNENNPCPLHHQVEPLKKQWYQLLETLTINDLLNEEKGSFLKSIIAS